MSANFEKEVLLIYDNTSPRFIYKYFPMEDIERGREPGVLGPLYGGTGLLSNMSDPYDFDNPLKHLRHFSFRFQGGL